MALFMLTLLDLDAKAGSSCTESGFGVNAINQCATFTAYAVKMLRWFQQIAISAHGLQHWLPGAVCFRLTDKSLISAFTSFRFICSSPV